jgi:hypothetical protein
MSVSTGPGNTAWTVISARAKSILIDCVALDAAALEME